MLLSDLRWWHPSARSSCTSLSRARAGFYKKTKNILITRQKVALLCRCPSHFWNPELEKKKKCFEDVDLKTDPQSFAGKITLFFPLMWSHPKSVFMCRQVYFNCSGWTRRRLTVHRGFLFFSFRVFHQVRPDICLFAFWRLDFCSELLVWSCISLLLPNLNWQLWF